MTNTYSAGETYVEPTAVGSWFRNPGVRETIESVLIAVLLALLFRFFEAEAYVIPTGSMAPDLQGRHIDVACPECDFNFRAGAREDGARRVTRVACPICQHPMALQSRDRRDHRPFSGDRILVSKFAYDFGEPERWDVIVFKYPNNGKQNFIKRLIGLPNEGILIERGDIYAFDRPTQTFADREICRKPPRKQKAMLQMVDDTNHIADSQLAAGWPSRWQPWDGPSTDSDWQVSEGLQQFSLSNPSDETRWLRYRHLRPRKDEWKQLGLRVPELPSRMQGEPPKGELITDYYAYNDTPINDAGMFSSYVGLHWVGDLAVEATVDVQSDTGDLLLELVEGGVKYQCQIDVSSGQATFGWSNSFNDDTVSFDGETTFETSVKGTGKYNILFANSDDKLFLWIDNRFVGGCEYSGGSNVVPHWSETDAGDAEPVSIGGARIEMEVNRLQVLRDIYYTSKNLTRQISSNDENPSFEYVGMDPRNPKVIKAITDLFHKPADWSGPGATRLFASRDRDETFVFPLEENQFMPMGDNSPQSNDARTWNGARYVDGSYLLGEALFIYWPHAKTSPLPFWPNFGRMNFIR